MRMDNSISRISVPSHCLIRLRNEWIGYTPCTQPRDRNLKFVYINISLYSIIVFLVADERTRYYVVGQTKGMDLVALEVCTFFNNTYMKSKCLECDMILLNVGLTPASSNGYA